MIKFSIIFPSRQRTPLLINLIKSIKKTTSNLDEIEVLIAYDSDDETFAFPSGEKFIQTFEMERLDSIVAYYNILATKTVGEYIITVNDDCEFETQDWDKLLWSFIEKNVPEDGIAYISVDDGYKKHKPVTEDGNNFSCFPILSNKSVKAMKQCFNKQFKAWGADTNIYLIFKTIDRVFYFNDMKIEHISYHNGLRERDDINVHVAYMHKSNTPDKTQNFIELPIERLKACLRED